MMNRMVNTINGELSIDDLGCTLVHEHTVSSYSGWFVDATRFPLDKDDAMTEIVDCLSKMEACGVQSFVDATPCENGRNVELLKELSAKTQINIIAVTGFFNEESGSSTYFKLMDSLSGKGTTKQEVADLMEQEITIGIEGSGIKAGAIKLATGSKEITPFEKILFSAGGSVQKATGVPVITHTENGMFGIEQADLLISEGANPTQIMIGHADSGDLRYYSKILEKGVFLGFDRFGWNSDVMGCHDSIRLGCLIALIQMGYVKQIMISHDRNMYWASKQLPLASEGAEYWNHEHIHKRIIPQLKKAGVSEDQIHTIMVENPKRLFGGA